MYNCFKVNEASTRGGFTKLGVDKVGSLFTRGVLIDVAGLKGVDMLPDTYEITVADLQQALARQNTSISTGERRLINSACCRPFRRRT